MRADSWTDTTVISLPGGGAARTRFSAVDLDATAPAFGPSAVGPSTALGPPTVGAASGAPFGLDWQHLPAVARRTTRGVPRYADTDVFVVSGTEDVLFVAGASPGRLRYRSRSDGLFSRVEHLVDDTGDVWEVCGRDGLVTRYGTPRPRNAPPGWRDPAVIADPTDRRRIFEWRVTRIQDPAGRVVTYEYLRNRNEEPGRADEPLLRRISHADYGDRANPAFAITVELDHERRPHATSDRRAGFEVRTTMRCRTIGVVTHGADGRGRLAGAYRLRYDDDGDAATPIHMEVATTDEVAAERRSA